VKRFLLVVLVIVMMISSVTAFACEECDMDVSGWAKDEVLEAIHMGIVPTFETYDFKRYVTHGEFAAIAVMAYEKLTGKEAEISDEVVTDISGNAHEDYIRKAYQLGIVNGRDNQRFGPDIPLTREQLSAMLMRMFKKYCWEDWTLEKDNEFRLNTDGAVVFADDSDIANYSKNSVYFLAKHGVINGIGDGKFCPRPIYDDDETGWATREQAICIAKRCLDTLFTDEVMENARAVGFNYEAVYSDKAEEVQNAWIEEKVDERMEFEKAIMLADVNDDGVPELFSVTWDFMARGYEFKDGKLVLAPEDTAFKLIDPDTAHKKVRTPYNKPEAFCGIYKEKSTGEISIISYHYYEGSTEIFSEFKSVSFDGQSFKAQELTGDPADILSNYELLENDFIGEYVLRSGIMRPKDFLDGIFTEYRECGGKTIIDSADSYNGYAYIDYIDAEKKEITFIPARMFTYEEYQKTIDAQASDDLFITDDGYAARYEENKGVHLWNTLYEEYYADVPSEDSPTVVKGHKNNEPLKAGYTSYMIDDYVSDFFELDDGGYYYIVVVDGNITVFDKM